MFLLGPMVSKYQVLKKHHVILTIFMLLLKICNCQLMETNKEINIASDETKKTLIKAFH